MKNVIDLLSNTTRNDLTGNRLWIDNLQPVLGFVTGNISFITYKNIRQGCLWECYLHINGHSVVPSLVDYRWTPASVISTYEAVGVRIHEKKYIDKNDCFVSVMELENTTECHLDVEFSIHTLLNKLEESHKALHNPSFVRWDNRGREYVAFQMILDCTARNIIREVVKPLIFIYSEGFKTNRDNCTLEKKLNIKKSQKERIIIVGQINHKPLFDVHEFIMNVHSQTDPYNAYDQYFNRWFDENVPEFICSDPYVEKMYYYRWFIAYKNLIMPGIDSFTVPCFYEGKDQFSVVCSASSAMQICETRWLKNREYTKGHITAQMQSQIKSGLDSGRFRDTYINNIPHAIWGMCVVHKDFEIVEKYINNIIHFIQWESSEQFVKHPDRLPVVIGSWRTASEYQPSFFEFTEPQWDHTLSAPFLKEHHTSLKRVDEAVYYYMNLKSIVNMLNRIGRSEIAREYAMTAETLKDSILKYMWDEETQFFYDLEPGSNQKALLSKNYAGFSPALTDIANTTFKGLFEHLKNPAEFHTNFPIPSVSRDCPAYNPDNLWTVGPNATNDNPYQYKCCWNGPSWNFSNSIIIDALGEFIQKNKNSENYGLFKNLFEKWTIAQYIDPDNMIPNTCEHFHPETGKQLSCVKDYFHSTYNDILIKRIIGIMTNDSDVLTIKPIDMVWDYFLLKGLLYRDKTIDIIWKSAASDLLSEYDLGFTVFVNGKRAAYRSTLRDVRVDLTKY